MAAKLTLTSVTLDSPDAPRLARFYARLLGWTVTKEEDPTWIMLAPPGGGVGINVQYESQYVRPTWPAAADGQRMMVHLEIQVDDLAAAVAHATECGATLADFQPQDDVRVCLDPDGHPFCLYLH
jgi:catechol 2,3-dioxygenase-like lactoylglutathione lyase family enzyme